MPNNSIYVTELDAERLQNLRDNPDLLQEKAHLQELAREIERAVIVAAEEVPPDVITMNSTARLIDTRTGEEMVLTLVYPENADLAEDKISVLAPIGMAMLGCKQGEVVEWEVPDGLRSFRVDRIFYQPEAAGEYTL